MIDLTKYVCAWVVISLFCSFILVHYFIKLILYSTSSAANSWKWNLITRNIFFNILFLYFVLFYVTKWFFGLYFNWFSNVLESKLILVIVRRLVEYTQILLFILQKHKMIEKTFCKYSSYTAWGAVRQHTIARTNGTYLLRGSQQHCLRGPATTNC